MPSPCSQSQSGGNYLKKATIRFQDNDFLRIDDSFSVDRAGELSQMVQKAALSSSAWRRIVRFNSRKIKLFVEKSDRDCSIQAYRLAHDKGIRSLQRKSIVCKTVLL